MARTGRPPKLSTQLSMVYEDIDDGCQQLAVLIHDARKMTKGLEQSYMHGSRAFRRLQIVEKTVKEQEQRITELMAEITRRDAETSVCLSGVAA